ncbi:class I SAM-dependent methyltransferase, partial [Candidatus Bathyarchaeota archaeon]|nr:class I SAM-dependent methyltransferase [Candidatus Bathyarchaeota archaeon]
MTTQPAVNSADEVLRLIEKASEKNFLPIIGPYKGRILAEEVRKAKPQHVLEVGTLIGYSAILIGKELNNKAEIVTIEIHRDEAELAGKNIVRANIPPKIKIITGDALQVIPTLKGPFDFAFIDAEKSEYYQYLTLAEDKLHKGTVVFADNAGIFADQMRDYL